MTSAERLPRSQVTPPIAPSEPGGGLWVMVNVKVAPQPSASEPVRVMIKSVSSGVDTAIISPGPPRLGPDPKWDRRNALKVICRLVFEAAHQAH